MYNYDFPFVFFRLMECVTEDSGYLGYDAPVQQHSVTSRKT